MLDKLDNKVHLHRFEMAKMMTYILVLGKFKKNFQKG